SGNKRAAHCRSAPSVSERSRDRDERWQHPARPGPVGAEWPSRLFEELRRQKFETTAVGPDRSLAIASNRSARAGGRIIGRDQGSATSWKNQACWIVGGLA